MKKNPALQFALIFVVLTAAFKAAAFAWLPIERGPAASVMAYLLGDVMAIALAFKAVQRPGEPPIFLQNFKDALRPALLFAIFVGAWAYAYHGYINPEYMETNKARQMQQAAEAWPTLKDQPGYKDITREVYMATKQKQADTMNKPFLHATFSIVGFFMFGVGFSLFLIVAFRRIPFVRKGLGG